MIDNNARIHHELQAHWVEFVMEAGRKVQRTYASGSVPVRTSEPKRSGVVPESVHDAAERMHRSLCGQFRDALNVVVDVLQVTTMIDQETGKERRMAVVKIGQCPSEEVDVAAGDRVAALRKQLGSIGKGPL